MSGEADRGTVIVVAPDPMQAARVEASLRTLIGWRIEVSAPRHLPTRLHDRPEAIVAIVLTDPGTRRMLRAMRSWPRSPAVVALSDEPARFWTAGFRAVGVRASLPLRAGAEELAGAVRAVQAGLFALHPVALGPVVTNAAGGAAGAPLTAREREILEQMADGVSNRIIAARLGISRHTVKFHVGSILAKLGAASRTEAVALAVRGGLLAV
jgi:DNA-binding NarL/FixJ family response regulator